jgi:rhodanese-related sulfurtransferase
MKTHRILLFCAFLVTVTVNGQVPDSLKFKTPGPAGFQSSLKDEEKPLLIDVREYFEYRVSRLRGAINIPASGNITIAADTLGKDHTLFLYCTSGFRSKRAARVFYDKGFTRLYSLDGGITAWRKAKMPLDRKRLKRHPKN